MTNLRLVGRPEHEASAYVVSRAAEILNSELFERSEHLARVYTTQGRHGSYKTIVYVNDAGEITDAECTCPASPAEPCSHLLAVLTNESRVLEAAREDT